MRVVRLGAGRLIAAAVAAALGACGPGPVTVDSCSDPLASGVASIDFLALGGDGSLVANFEAHPLILGPQGGSMVELRFALQGQAVPECASFTMTVDRCNNASCSDVSGEETYSRTDSLQTYEGTLGRSTKNYLLLLPYAFGTGSLVRIQAAVGSAEGSVLAWIESEGEFSDAGPADAAWPDAMP